MKNISVQDLRNKRATGQSHVLIDVREPYEYEEYNLGGRLIPLGELMNRIPELQELKNEEIVVHCRSGARSAMATELLTNAGFKNVSNLTGGILEWKEAFPV